MLSYKVVRKFNVLLLNGKTPLNSMDNNNRTSIDEIKSFDFLSLKNIQKFSFIKLILEIYYKNLKFTCDNSIKSYWLINIYNTTLSPEEK